MTKRNLKVTCSIQCSKGMSSGKHPGRCAFAEPELLCFRKPKRVVMVGLKWTLWTLRYEVEISNFSKLAVFEKLWHDLSDKFQAFYTFLCRNLCKSGININAGLMAWTLCYSQLMENMFGTVFKISFWKVISPGQWAVSPVIEIC